MKRIYMSVSITTYEHGLGSLCYYYEHIDDNPFTSRKITLEEALKLMWELKLAGGEKTVSTHPYCNKINYRDVTYWMCH